MSEAPAEERDWRLCVQDMIGFCEKVLSYTDGMDQAAFLADGRTYDATLRNLELIGEAAARVPEEVSKSHPEIDWRGMVAARNRLAHGYMGINDDIIWDIIQTEVPGLLPELRNLLDATSEDPA